MRLNKKTPSSILRFRAAPKQSTPPIHDPENPSEEVIVEDTTLEGRAPTRPIPPRQARKGKGAPRNALLLGAGGVLVLLTGLLLLRPQSDPADTFASDSLVTVESSTIAPPPSDLTASSTPSLSGQPGTENTTSSEAKPATKDATKTDPKKKPGEEAEAASKRSTREARGAVATDVPNVFQAIDESGAPTVNSGNLSNPISNAEPLPQAPAPTYNPAPAPQAAITTAPTPQNAAPPVPQTASTVSPQVLTQPPATTRQNITSSPIAITRVTRPATQVAQTAPPRVRTLPTPQQPTTVQPVTVPLTPTVVELPRTQRLSPPVTVTPPATPPATTVTLTQAPSTPATTPAPSNVPATVILTPAPSSVAVPQLQVQAIVTGNTPMATIRTPTGEQVVGIGEKLLETPYTVKAIKAQSVTLEEENTTSDLTLKLEDNT